MTTTTHNRHALRLTVLTVGLLAGSLSVAQAATPAQTDAAPAVTVKYDDLNVWSREGAQTLYRRLADAAKQVCPKGDPRDLALAAVAQSCRSAAIERAVHEINSPQLAALTQHNHLRG